MRVEDISREIEEADNIISRVLDMQNFIAENRRKSKLNLTNKIEQNVVNIQTTSTNSNSEGLPTNASIEEPNSQVTELQAPSDTDMSNTSELFPNSQGQVNQKFVEQSQQLNVHPNNGIPGGPIYCRPKLPNLVLPRFKGEITNYCTFWDSFDNAVHKNPGLPKIDKFNYLNSLLEGRALKAIQGLTVTEDNYEAAVEILQQRFGKTQQTISVHMDELMKIPACNSTDKPSQLRYIYDKISVHTRGLASLGVDSKQYGSLLIPVIMAKLPQEVRIQIARTTKKKIWDISEILDVILHEVEAREVSENVKINSEPRNHLRTSIFRAQLPRY